MLVHLKLIIKVRRCQVLLKRMRNFKKLLLRNQMKQNNIKGNSWQQRKKLKGISF